MALQEKRQKWDKKKIINKVLKRKKNNLSLNSETTLNNNPQLHHSAINYFGSWQKAIEASGLNYDDVRLVNRWSKQKVIEEIKKRYNTNKPLNPNDVIKENNALYHAGRYHFKTWERAIEAAGLDPHEVYLHANWTEKEIEFLKDGNKSHKELSSILLNRSSKTINQQCCKMRIKRNKEVKSRSITETLSKLSLKKIDEISKNSEFKEIIEGCLLGDGCISSSNKFSVGTTCRNHAGYVQKQLNRLGFSIKLRESKQKGQILDGRKIKPSVEYICQVQNKILFESYRKKWYSNKKTIPKNIELTPTVCLFWFIGDGSLHKGKAEITFCTDCFVLNDIKLLVKKMFIIGFNPTYRKTGISKKGEKCYRISLYGPDVFKFLNYIGPYPFEDYAHKWDISKLLLKKTTCPGCGCEVEYITKKKNPIQRKRRCNNCKERWDKYKILKKILNMHKNNKSLDSSTMMKNEAQLRHAAINCFGSWKAAIEKVGLDYSKITKLNQPRYNYDEIISLQKNGLSFQKIKQKTGISASQFQRIIDHS